MTYLVTYDISHDGLRQKVANQLQYFGLVRVQYSVFLGPLSKKLKRETVDFINKIPRSDQWSPYDQVLFVPISDNQLRQLTVVGKAPHSTNFLLGKASVIFI